MITALGFGTVENLSAMRSGRSGICRIDDNRLFAEPFMAGHIDEVRLQQQVADCGLKGYTRMEQLFILSLQSTIRQSGVDPTDPDCGLILSTTKGNIDSIREESPFLPDAMLYGMGKHIAEYFHFTNEPVIVSNACISGVSALIIASRLIEAKRYKHIVVAGGDLLTRFVVTGFQSFKSISPVICRPYDAERQGLSLGEACGSVLLTSERSLVRDAQPIRIEGGAITNDANHISGPSRTGDGLYNAITQAMRATRLVPDDISFVNTHGTATVYNDEMESKAIHWAELDAVPLNSLKGYWGHTLGASGIIESIACLEELRSGEVLGTYGYETCGVPFPLKLSADSRLIPMKRCVKTASGFGGCNAAIVFGLPVPALDEGLHEDRSYTSSVDRAASLAVPHHVRRQVVIKEGTIFLDGKILLESKPEEDFSIFIRAAYKSLSLEDRKFYKMDDLCKLGYVAMAYLLKEKEGETGYAPEEVGMVLANASSSLDTDLKYQHIIDTLGDKEASPAVFVYTLPNVVMGELCIRYKIQGENTFFISDRYPETFVHEYAADVMARCGLKACLVGWCELLGETYEARFKWLERTK